jgi:hypothetical protein
MTETLPIERPGSSRSPSCIDRALTFAIKANINKLGIVSERRSFFKKYPIELLYLVRPRAAKQKGRHVAALRKTDLLLLLGRRLSLSVSRLHRCSNAGQHLFRGISVRTVGLELDILLEGLGCSRGCYELPIFAGGGLAHQVHAFPVVGVGFFGIGGDW